MRIQNITDMIGNTPLLGMSVIASKSDENEYVRKAYFSLGEELSNELEQISYVFVAVSTC